MPRLSRTLLAAILFVGLAPAAQALSLADLNAGASFSSADGALTFSDFRITLPATIGGSANALAGIDLALF